MLSSALVSMDETEEEGSSNILQDETIGPESNAGQQDHALREGPSPKLRAESSIIGEVSDCNGGDQDPVTPYGLLIVKIEKQH
jgi:hypothetical protein